MIYRINERHKSTSSVKNANLIESIKITPYKEDTVLNNFNLAAPFKQVNKILLNMNRNMNTRFVSTDKK